MNLIISSKSCGIAPMTITVITPSFTPLAIFYGTAMWQQFMVGNPLKLVREWNHYEDPNAIAVWMMLPWGWLHLGSLPEEVAAVLVEASECGGIFIVEIEEVPKAEGTSCSVVLIEIVDGSKATESRSVFAEGISIQVAQPLVNMEQEVSREFWARCSFPPKCIRAYGDVVFGEVPLCYKVGDRVSQYSHIAQSGEITLPSFDNGGTRFEGLI
jgi:hypothetical protein